MGFEDEEEQLADEILRGDQSDIVLWNSLVNRCNCEVSRARLSLTRAPQFVDNDLSFELGPTHR
jgi:hypothetical protein